MTTTDVIYRRWTDEDFPDALIREIATELEASRVLELRSIECSQLEFLIGCLVVELGENGGCTLLSEIRQCGSLMQIVYLSRSAKPKAIVEAIRNGAIDVLQWPQDRDRLRDAMIRAMAVSRESLQRQQEIAAARSKVELLTPGELDVLRLSLDAIPHKRVCRLLNIAQRTVEARRQRIFQKMRTRSMVEIAELLRKCNVELTFSSHSIKTKSIAKASARPRMKSRPAALSTPPADHERHLSDRVATTGLSVSGGLPASPMANERS